MRKENGTKQRKQPKHVQKQIPRTRLAIRYRTSLPESEHRNDKKVLDYSTQETHLLQRISLAMIPKLSSELSWLIYASSMRRIQIL